MGPPHGRIATRRLILLWTSARCLRDPWETLALALEGGVDVVQVREKSLAARQVAAVARRAKSFTERAGALLFVNDRCDVAAAAGADGVHLGQTDLDVASARRVLPPSAAVGVSTHSLAQVAAACEEGADLVGFGPLYPTATKPREPAIGPADLAAAERDARRPVFAIGGLDAARIAAVGAGRAAVSSAILDAADPLAAARAIRAALERNDAQRSSIASP